MRERVGTASEQVETEAATVAELIAELCTTRRGLCLCPFSDTGVYPRRAFDQQLVEMDAPLSGAREVAFFPPMTGG